MTTQVRPYLAELIGTFAVVFLGAGSVCAAHMPESLGQGPLPLATPLGFVGIALATGFAMAVALSATINVSGGYLNPAVTLTLWVFKRLDGTRALWLIVAQMLGAILAGGLLRLTFAGEELLKVSRLGTPHLNLLAFTRQEVVVPKLEWLMTGIGVELVLTFLVTFAIFGTVLDPRAPRLGGLGVGLALASAIFMGYQVTGAATNPARWLGTAVWELTIPTDNVFRDHAVYWIGPILGALLAGLVYTTLILPPEEERRVMMTAPGGAATAPPHPPSAVRARS